MTSLEVEKEYPFKVTIISHQMLTADEILLFWRDPRIQFHDILVFKNEIISKNPWKAQVTYGFKDPELATMFKLRFA